MPSTSPPQHSLPELDPEPQSPTTKTQQLYDAFLVLDVEATCFQGTDFNYPNEIIEFPICLMKWQDMDLDSKASKLQVVDEFRSFVRPSWRPTLSAFCTDLTGITQDQVDSAPLFPDVLKAVRKFMVKNGLIDADSGKRLVRYCWCSDGPFDIRDFVVKQCFISNIPMPKWIRGDILDVRMAVMQWLSIQPPHSTNAATDATRPFFPPVRRSLNIPGQLKALGLPAFQGRQHSGIDDTRNIAKIVTELARKGICLLPNTTIKPGRRWLWMGKRGKILEEFCLTFNDSGVNYRPASPSPTTPSPTPHNSPVKFRVTDPTSTTTTTVSTFSSKPVAASSAGARAARTNHVNVGNSHGHHVVGMGMGMGRSVGVGAPAAACVS